MSLLYDAAKKLTAAVDGPDIPGEAVWERGERIERAEKELLDTLWNGSMYSIERRVDQAIEEALQRFEYSLGRRDG